MFYPALLSLVFLLLWFAAEKDLSRGPKEFPADIVTGDRFKFAYVNLVSDTMLYGALLAAAVLFGESLGARDMPALQTTFFVAGIVTSLPLIRRALATADLFVAMDHAGRGEGRDPGDYLPSLVLMPLVPAMMGAFY